MHQMGLAPMEHYPPHTCEVCISWGEGSQVTEAMLRPCRPATASTPSAAASRALAAAPHAIEGRSQPPGSEVVEAAVWPISITPAGGTTPLIPPAGATPPGRKPECCCCCCFPEASLRRRRTSGDQVWITARPAPNTLFCSGIHKRRSPGAGAMSRPANSAAIPGRGNNI